MNEKDKEYYSRPEIKQHRKEYMKTYHKDNEDEQNERSAEYYANHSEQWKEYRKKWCNYNRICHSLKNEMWLRWINNS